MAPLLRFVRILLAIAVVASLAGHDPVFAGSLSGPGEPALTTLASAAAVSLPADCAGASGCHCIPARSAGCCLTALAPRRLPASAVAGSAAPAEPPRSFPTGVDLPGPAKPPRLAG